MEKNAELLIYARLCLQHSKQIHIIYTYKDKVYQAHKNWTFDRAERVLKRLGATYWEIGI